MRKAYIDNLRCGVVLLVIVYHVIYMFNTVGIISNVTIMGIPQAEGLMYAVYPWFMAIMFLLAGISARYALEKTDVKSYRKARVRKLLIPSVAGIFIYGWIGGWITDRYVDMFAGNVDLIPGVVKYLVYCMSGIGPLWFMHELFLATMLLLLIHKLDKEDKLWKLGERAAKWWVLCLLVLAVWGSAYLLNTPLIEVYRNGFYFLFFFLGYYVFSHEEVMKEVEKCWLPFLVAAVGLGVAYTVFFWGENFTTLANLKKPLTNAYAWFATLALLGCGRRWWNKETAFTRYMRPRSFGFYVLHYILLAVITYVADLYFELSFPAFYVILLVLEMILLPVVFEVVKRIPVVKRLVLGL